MNDESLHQIVYISEADRPMETAELLRILERARRNNRRLDITGLLLYRDQRFIQILEGPRSAVQTIFSIIAMDGLHHSVNKLIDLPAERRLFLEWSMAFTEITDEMADAVPGFSFFMKQNYPAELGDDPGGILEMLGGFRGYLN